MASGGNILHGSLQFLFILHKFSLVKSWTTEIKSKKINGYKSVGLNKILLTLVLIILQ